MDALAVGSGGGKANREKERYRNIRTTLKRTGRRSGTETGTRRTERKITGRMKRPRMITGITGIIKRHSRANRATP